jgi:uncharacterized membrane protein YfcA
VELTHHLVIGVAVLAAAFVQGSTGFGFALICGPVVAMVQPRLLPVFLLIQMVPLNGYVAWRERHALDVRGTSWVGFGRVVGTFGGAALLVVVSERQLGLLIGVSTVLAVGVSLLAPSFEPGRWSLVTAGTVTGVTETSTGVGGPPLALVFQHRPAPVLRATVAACFLLGEVVSLAVLALAGTITADQVRSAFFLLPAVVAGALLSRLAHHRLEGALTRRIVLGFALVSGVAVTVQAL